MSLKNSNPIQIVVNGKSQVVSSETSVAALLITLEIKSKAIAVEVNQEIQTSDQFEHVYLKEGDVLEIVTLVGGG